MLDKLKTNNIYNDDIDEEYWINQPQVILPNYSNYIIFPKQGIIWSKKTNKWIGNKNNKNGYWQCHLISDDNKQWNTKIHRVVWIAVNGDIPKGYEVNHIDENKDNNSITNLNLMTRKENINYGSRNDRVAKVNTNNPKRSKQVGAFKNGSLIMIFPSTMEAGRQGYNQGHISACCNGSYLRQGNNTYKGFQWQYL